MGDGAGIKSLEKEWGGNFILLLGGVSLSPPYRKELAQQTRFLAFESLDYKSWPPSYSV